MKGVVSFPCGEVTLHGRLYAPEGSGPFPAVLWNHGSERSPGPAEELASFYTSEGFVLFTPHRPGHGGSPGNYPLDALRQTATADTVIDLLMQLHARYLEGTRAAVDWLAGLPFVDGDRMAMSGVSHGGIQTIVAAEADVGARAYVPFAPGAMAWDSNPELAVRLLGAVRAASAPIFLLQAENDFSLGPSEVLGEELRRKGRPNRARTYPPYGDSPSAGHGGFGYLGTDVWGSDVRDFLDAVLRV